MLDLALPDRQCAPAHPAQRALVQFVTLHVSLELSLPKFRAALWQIRNSAPLVCMPKATMNEDSFPARREDKVGFSGQVFAMKSIPIPEVEQRLTHRKLGTSVLAADARHSLATLGFRQSIHGLPVTSTLSFTSGSLYPPRDKTQG
jgi:hypothetical protein